MLLAFKKYIVFGAPREIYGSRQCEREREKQRQMQSRRKREGRGKVRE